MKKLTRSAIIAFVFGFVLLYHTAFAQNYTYFNKIDTNYPEDSIISDNVAYVGGVYYMSKQAGGLYYSHDARGWRYIDGSENSRIVSDHKRYSDKLIVFNNGSLDKSHDGASWTLLHQFLPDTVVRYDNGAYIAFEKESADAQGGTLYFSFDAETWVKPVGDVRVLDGRFTLNQYRDKFILNGIHTEQGTMSAVLLFDGSVHALPYNYLEYDTKNGIYAAIDDTQDGIALWKGTSLDGEFTPILPWAEGTAPLTNASYFDGSFYTATVEGNKVSDIYKSNPDGSWEPAAQFYMPLYKTVDEGGSEREVYIMHDSSKNSVNVVVLKNGDSITYDKAGVTLANGLKFNIYGSVFGITMADRPSNLLSTDGLNWHQVDDASAFSILNAHALRGDYLFVDRTTDHTVLEPKGDPYEGIGYKGVEVRVDGWYIAFDQPPVIVNDRTLVPLRAIAESIGAEVGYDGATKTITLHKGGNIITMQVGGNTAHITYYDGAEYDAYLDSPATLINDRTLVPVRFIADTFGFNVEWAADTKTVWLNSK